MEKRAIVAFAISIAVFLAWVTFLAPAPEQPPAGAGGTGMEDTASPADDGGAGSAGDAGASLLEDAAPRGGDPFDEGGTDDVRDAGSDAAADSGAGSGADDAGEADGSSWSPALEARAESTIEIGTARYIARLTNRGGHVVSWRLKEYRDVAGNPLELIPSFRDAGQRTLGIEVHGAADRGLNRRLREALWAVERDPVEGGTRVRLRWSDGQGVEAIREFTFRDDRYAVDVRQEVRERGRSLDTALTLGPGFAAQDFRKGRSNYYYDGYGLWKIGGEVEHTKRKDLADTREVVVDGRPVEIAGGERTARYVEFAGLEDQFFTALVLPSAADRPVTIAWTARELIPIRDVEAAEEAEEQPEARDEPLMSVAVANGGAEVYIGPKKYRLLKAEHPGLEDAVWFSSYGWLAFIVKRIYLGLLWLHDNVYANWGVAIVLATFILRVALFPLNQFAMVRMKKSQLQMQRLQPKINAIKNRYRKQKDAQSRAKMNQEMMDLYKVEGVNPAGGIAGCLPLLIQFPILIGFYNMLTVAVELRAAPFFGWIQDLSVKDPYFITPILMGVTMFTQQKMAMTKVKDPQQLQQQRIMLFMPFMFTFICLQMPAGLVVYWFVNNILGIGQQWLVNKHTSRIEAEHEAAQSGKGKKKAAQKS